MQKIYLIASCTSAKRLNANEDLKLHNYDFSDFGNSISEWSRNIAKNDTRKCIARELYSGVSWKATLDAEKNLSKLFDVELLVSSAGHGLIKSEVEISSYSVTFSKNSIDSVYNFLSDDKEKTARWWREINTFDISRLHRDAKIFIALPYEYLMAMKETIKELVKLFKDNLFIFTINKKILPDDFYPNIIYFNANFNSFERGTFSSILARFTRWLSAEIVNNELNIKHDELQRYVDDFLNGYSKPVKKVGRFIGNDEIKNYVHNQIKNEQISSATRGLRHLRENGLACEQKRYKKIFDEVKSINV